MTSIATEKQKELFKIFVNSTLSKGQLYWAVSWEWISDFKIHIGFTKGHLTKQFPRRIDQSPVPEFNCFVPWILWKELANWYGLTSLKETIPFSIIDEDKNAHVIINVAKVLKDGTISEPEPFIINIHQYEYYLHFQLHHQMNVSRDRSTKSRLILAKQTDFSTSVDIYDKYRALALEYGCDITYLKQCLIQMPTNIESPSKLRAKSTLTTCIMLNRLLNSLINHDVMVCAQLGDIDLMEDVKFNEDDYKEVYGGIIIETMLNNKWPSRIPHPCDDIKRHHFKDLYSIDIENNMFKQGKNIPLVPATTKNEGFSVKSEQWSTIPKVSSEQDIHSEKILNVFENFRFELDTNITGIVTSNSKLLHKSMEHLQVNFNSRQTVLNNRYENLKIKNHELVQKEQSLHTKKVAVNTKKEGLAQKSRHIDSKAQELQDLEAQIQDGKAKLLTRTSNYQDKVHTGDSSTISERITLDVGGREFETTTRTLTSVSNSLLADLFKPGSDFRNTVNRYFLDRDGDLFSYILKYLRIGKDIVELLPKNPILLKELELEAKFFGLQEMKELVGNVLKR